MLAHDRRRLVFACLGIAFAVLLMLVEQGFLHGVYDSAVLPVDALAADLVLTHANKRNFVDTDPFPRERLMALAGADGVAEVAPLWVEPSLLFRAEGGTARRIRTLAVDPARSALDPSVPVHLLTRSDTLLFDAGSRPLFGDPRPGDRIELGGRRMEVVGVFEMGPDLGYFGNVLVSDATLALVDPRGRGRLEEIEMGALRLAPGADAAEVLGRLGPRLPPDAALRTPAGLRRDVQAYWKSQEPAGAVFGLGMAIGFAVGVIVCAEILTSLVDDHLHLYATLKAIGYRSRFVVSTVFFQAVVLALLGFWPGLFAALAAFGALEAMSGIPMEPSGSRSLLVLVLTVGMCALASLVAVRRSLSADPAELF